MKHKYKLKFWDRVTLPLLWLHWKLSIAENKKETWHEVVSGIEIHEHKFTIPHTELGYKFMKCDHYGCNLLDPIDERLEIKSKIDDIYDKMNIQQAREFAKSSIHECRYCHKDFIGWTGDNIPNCELTCKCVHCGSWNSFRYWPASLLKPKDYAARNK